MVFKNVINICLPFIGYKYGHYVKYNILPSLEYGRLSNPSAEDIPSWIKVLDVTDLSLSDKFFEQMPTGIDRIYAPSNELTSLRISSPLSQSSVDIDVLSNPHLCILSYLIYICIVR